MHCPNCSTTNDSDACYCSECGRPITGETKTQQVKTRRQYLFVLLLVPVLAIAGAAGYYKFFLPDGVSAVVNGEAIKRAELDAAVSRIKSAYNRINFEGDQGAEALRFRYHVLNSLITERLVLQEARKTGFVVPDQEVAAAVLRSQAASGMARESFEAAVAQQYGSFPAFEEAVKRELTVNKFIFERVVPTGADARTADTAVTRWIKDLYSKATVRITLAEQWSGAGCGSCSKRAEASRAPHEGCAGCAMNNKKPSPSAGAPDKGKALEAALKYWHEKHGGEKVTAKLTDFGCHIQVDIMKDNKIISSLRYQGGNISEQ